jgi:hypothetical protein
MNYDMQAGDIGTIITITVKDSVTLAAKDISSASVKKFLVKHTTTGATSEKTAIFTTTGADGKLYYVTLATDFPTAGVYRIQPYVEIGSIKLKSSIVEINVGANVPAVVTP